MNVFNFADMPPQNEPRPTVPPRGSRDRQNAVLRALWNLQAFDSDHAVSVGEIAKAAGEYETSKPIRKAVLSLLENGAVEFVLANKRAPKPGEEMQTNKRYYFKDKEEFVQ